MKKVMTMMAALMLCVGFTACSDKEDEPAIPAAKEVAGVYNGNMVGTAMGIDMPFDDVDVTITPVDDSHVSVTVASFGNPPMQLPEIPVTGVAVSGTDGSYTLAATEFSGTSADGKKYSGTMQGTVNEALTLQMTINYGSMPMPLVCSYTATKK